MLNIKNLSIEFTDKGYRQQVVKDFSMTLNEGEIIGIAGESGSGKTLTAYAIDGILPEHAIISSGEIIYNDVDLLKLNTRDQKKIHGSRFGMVFQEPLTSLNPLYKVGPQVEENLLLHTKLNKAERREKALEMLKAVELKDAEGVYNSYPHELSGGMRQRVMIASALIHSPEVLIADEPTTALDVIVQAQLIKLLKKLNKKYNIAIIFISHNLLVLKNISDRIIVMKKGAIVEEGSADKIFNNPENEYTMELVNAL